MISRRWRGLRVRRNGALGKCALIALATLCAATAQAGHAPLVPEPRTILLRKGDAEHVVIGTRRGGYFVTRDGGSSWSWICEAGVGYDDEEVYPGVLLDDGSLVVSTGFGGLAVSPDGCAWSPWLPSEQPFVADVRASSAGDRVVALEARARGDSFVNQLWESADHGASWRALGQPFAQQSQALSFALTATGEIYVSSAGADGAELWRADADAQGWGKTLLTDEPATQPHVVGAHGTGDDTRVYVVLNRAQLEGVSSAGDSLLISSDAGVSFDTALQATGALTASALSADGERLAIGGHSDGLYVLEQATKAPRGVELQSVASRPVHALAWGEAGELYAAGHEALDGFSVGVSTDAGRSFSPLFALCQVQGPLACSADSSVGQQCSSSGETGWDVRKEVADPDACRAGNASAESPVGAGGAESHSPVEEHSSAESDSDARSQGGCAFARVPGGAASGTLHVVTVLLLSFARRGRKRTSLAGSSSIIAGTDQAAGEEGLVCFGRRAEGSSRG